ncbi:DUF2905 domain-containing protein [Mesotoga sp. HF07.pep.5.2.highcov]|uniref:DUF2905 domain-containing protein n=1 Tax=Mesotoga sp. HF07.pep.5.2.highcov TaxID=1462923 RepID=UPI0038F819F0
MPGDCFAPIHFPEGRSQSGKLPGDIHVSRDGFEFWFPITSGFIVSVCITGMLWLWKFISKFF